MSYQFEGRVRYSEIGENGRLTLPGVMDYFQDCSTFHSEAIGQGYRTLMKRQRVWVLSAGQVVVNRYPELGEEIVISTFPYDFRGFMGKRNFVMETKDGERLAYANTFWTNLSTVTGHPVKLTEEDTAGYELEEKLDMEYAPRKITLPQGFEKGEEFCVQKHHLDTNHHVNNCQYIRMAEDYLPEDFTVYQMRAEYRRQAVLHDRICPAYHLEKEKVTVVLGDGAQSPYAVVEFTAKSEP